VGYKCPEASNQALEKGLKVNLFCVLENGPPVSNDFKFYLACQSNKTILDKDGFVIRHF
jgi:hypothetical protein